MTLQANSRLIRSLWGNMNALFLLGVLLFMLPTASNAADPAHYRDGRFHNQATLPQDGAMNKLRIGLKYLLLRKPPRPDPLRPSACCR